MRLAGRSPPVKLPKVALGDTQLLLLLSILIGVASGLLIVCFHIAIDTIRWATFGLPGVGNPIAIVISPALGAIAATLMVRYLFPQAKGSGVIHTKAAVHIYDGVVPASTVPGKFAACAVSIGSGNSLGPEDPSLQMGAGIASMIGRAFGLPRDHLRLIAPVGAAAGIAAAFNTPITAVLFVIEEVIGSWNASVLGSILLSAVSAVVVNRWYLGDEPLFRVPALGAIPPSDLVIYAVIGVIGGLASGLYVRLMLSLKRRSKRVRRPALSLLLPGITGLLVGIVGLWLPQVMGPGYITIDSALHDRFNWQTLFVLALAKIALTSFCFASGTPGGLFAPTLFAGAMIGGGIGALAQQYWPFPQAAPGAFVLVGMGTFFAGVFRAPMTSIFMVFEVTASYQIILPVMVANTVGYLVARQSRLHLFDELARDEGVDLPSVQEERELREFHVEDAMSGAAVIVGPGVSLAEARERLEHGESAVPAGPARPGGILRDAQARSRRAAVDRWRDAARAIEPAGDRAASLSGSRTGSGAQAVWIASRAAGGAPQRARHGGRHPHAGRCRPRAADRTARGWLADGRVILSVSVR